MDLLYGAATALSGVLVTKLLEFWGAGKSFRRQKVADLADETRRSLERVYQLLEQHRNEVSLTVTKRVGRLQFGAEMTWETSTLPWAELRMRIALYVPELIPAYEQFKNAYESHFVPVLIRAFGAPVEGIAASRELMAALGDLNTAYTVLFEAIEASFRRYTAAVVTGSHTSSGVPGA